MKESNDGKKFNLVMVQIGYHKYLMPKPAAQAFFDACVGEDFYIFDTEWQEGENIPYIRSLSYDECPKLGHFNPAEFLRGQENQAMKEAKKASERAAKANST